MSDKEQVEFKNLMLGSNFFEGTYSPISYENRNGKFEPLFKLEKNDQDFLLSAVIRDENGKFLGSLNRNSFILGRDKSLAHRKFETKRVPNSFLFSYDEKNIFSADVENDGSCAIRGIFHVKVGKREKIVRIEINDSETIIFHRIVEADNTVNFITHISMSNNDIMNNGGIKLAESGVLLGSV